MFLLDIIIIIIQSLTAGIAFSQIKRSQSIAWKFIALGLILITGRSIVGIVGLKDSAIIPDLITLFISLIMLLGVVLITFTFRAHNQNLVFLKTLQNIERITLTSLTQKSMVNGIKEAVREIFQPDAMGIYLLNKDGHSLQVLSDYNLNNDFHSAFLSDDIDFLKTVFETRRAIVYNSDRSDNLGLAGLILKSGFATCILSPVVIRGAPIGLISLFMQKIKRFTRTELRVINAICDHLAAGIEKWQNIMRIKETSIEAVMSLVQAIEMRDPYTKGHSFAVANLAVEIGRRMDFSEDDLELLRYAGLLHDVGKIAVPESILQKPGTLDEKEWKIMKQHPIHSAKTIEPIRNLTHIYLWVLYHHERCDGTGYPDGIKLDMIPLQSRILAVADTYSALTSDRPYRKARSIESALTEIKRVAGTQLDPGVVEVFLKIFTEGKREDKKLCEEWMIRGPGSNAPGTLT